MRSNGRAGDELVLLLQWHLLSPSRITINNTVMDSISHDSGDTLLETSSNLKMPGLFSRLLIG